MIFKNKNSWSNYDLLYLLQRINIINNTNKLNNYTINKFEINYLSSLKTYTIKKLGTKLSDTEVNISIKIKWPKQK